MHEQFLNDPDDLSWAQEVHGVPKVAKSFIISGSEDAPDSIEWFKEKDPTITSKGTIIKYSYA